MERGDRIAFDQRVDAMLREEQESPHPFAEWYGASFRIARLHRAARFVEAEAEARRALALPGPGGAEFCGAVFDLQMAGIRHAEGRLDEYVEELRCKAWGDRPPTWQIQVALGDALAGRQGPADDVLSAYTADDLAAIRRDVNWPVALVLLAELCVALERQDTAEVLLTYLAPFEGCHFVYGAAWLHHGSIARRIGLLAALLGRSQEAERLLRAAIERDAAMHAPMFVAQGRLELARLLARSRSRAACGEVRSLVESVLGEASALGLKRLRTQAQALIER